MSGSAQDVQMGAAGSCSCGCALLGRAATRLHLHSAAHKACWAAAAPSQLPGYIQMVTLYALYFAFKKGMLGIRNLTCGCRVRKRRAKGSRFDASWKNIGSLTDLRGVHASRAHGSACCTSATQSNPSWAGAGAIASDSRELLHVQLATLLPKPAGWRPQASTHHGAGRQCGIKLPRVLQAQVRCQVAAVRASVADGGRGAGHAMQLQRFRLQVHGTLSIPTSVSLALTGRALSMHCWEARRAARWAGRLPDRGWQTLACVACSASPPKRHIWGVPRPVSSSSGSGSSSSSSSSSSEQHQAPPCGLR